LDHFGSASIKFKHLVLGENFLEDANWQDTAKGQQASLNELGDVLNRVGEKFPKLYHKVNVDHRILLNQVKQDIKVLKEEKETLDAMVGNFVLLAQVHGSAAGAVRDAFFGLNGQRSDILFAYSDYEFIRDSLATHIKRLEDDFRTMFRVIKKVACTNSS